MKNLKKVLAMVLAFACTFTMFASAKVYEDVQPGTEFSEAITMLSDLGIIQGKTDGKYHPEETITRAEACALIARLLTGDPNVSNFGGAQNFTDVVKGSWQESAVGYCVANGITVGVGKGKFEPNRAINDQEFLTMLVRALGYETPDMKQGYPFSYMSAARAIGLVDNTQMLANTDALRGEDAQVIYNAMFVDYAKGAKMINTTHGTSVEKYPTLAESVWGLNRAALGTWNKKDNDDVTLSNCKAHSWVIIGEAQDEEDALLAYPIDDNDDTDLYKAEEKKHEYKAYKFKYAGDADALRGYKVELWGAGKHGAPVWEKEGDKFVYSEDWNIKAIKTVAGQTKYDYNSSMADKKNDNGTIELGETSLKLGSVADNAKNVQHSDEVNEVVTFLGDKLNTVAIKGDKDVEKALNVRNGMQFKLMDWDSDGDIDWIVVDEARYYKVESATSKRVVVASMKGDDLKSNSGDAVETWKIDGTEKLSTNDAKKDVKIKYEVPKGLKEGDIVEVTYKVTFEGKAQLITATVKTVDADNQKLEKVGTKDGLTLTFGDKEVKVAQNAKDGDVIVPKNPETYKGFNGEELGTEFALYKNRNGFLVYSDYATESSNYMMVLNTAGGKDTTGSRDLAVIDFVDANNKEHKDVKVSSSARVLAKNGDTLATTAQKAYVDRKFDESQVVGNVFKYWTDADGVITKMQAVFNADDAKADAAKVGYTYKADADRLIDNNNKYVASLEDANVIFAVKEDYVKADTKTGKPVLTTADLKVNASDVLATKQKDIPNIGTSEDTKNKELLLDTGDVRNTWLGTNADNDNHFVVDLNKNNEATAAVLGVNNFNKFNAGQTKLALVTNVSENSKGVIEAEVAFDGKVETIASAEKQDFDGIVKVFDGTNDQDVARADAIISAPGNDVFNGGKLSELVNEGGQYAEVTTDADGKLTKLVFMDDDKTNKNKLTGHYYTVSRNLVLEVKDNNLKYALNDNKRYHDVVADQRFAGSGNLFSTGRLEADSKGYTSDAKFYEIDAKPSRHDKDYTGTRLTVNAGFDNLDQRDIKAVEKTDIGYNTPDYRANKNHYEVADLAYKIDGDLVAVYSFKSMDEKAVDALVGVELSSNSIKPTESMTVNASVLHTKNTNVITTFKVYDKSGADVTDKFTVTLTSGYGSTDVVATVAPKAGVMNGEYTIKAAASASTVFEAGRKFTVTDAANKIVTAQVKFAKYAGGSYDDTDNKFYAVDKDSFVLRVLGEARARTIDQPISNVTAENLKVTLEGQPKKVTKVVDKGNGYHVVTLEGVDFYSAPDNNKTLAVTLVNGGSVELPAAGLNQLIANTDGKLVANGGDEITGGQTTKPIEGVGNVGKVEPPKDIPTVDPVTSVDVKLTTANGVPVTGLKAKDFTAKVGSANKMEDVTLSDGSSRALTAIVKENATTKGKYDFTFTEDLRGKTVEITVNGKSTTIAVPVAQVSFKLSPETIDVAKKEVLSNKKATVSEQKNVDGKELRVWQDKTKYADATTTVTDTGSDIKAEVSALNINLTGTVKDTAPTGPVVFYVGYGDAANEKKTLTVNVGEATVNYVATVYADQNATALIGDVAPAGGNDIFVKLTADGTAVKADRVTVDGQTGVTASDVGTDVIKLHKGTAWTAETYKLFVDGKDTRKTIIVANPSMNIAAAGNAKFYSDTVVTFNVTDIKGLTEAQVKALTVDVKKAVADDNTAKAKYVAPSVVDAGAKSTTFTIASKKDGTNYLKPGTYTVTLKNGGTEVGTVELTVDKKTLTASIANPGTSAKEATFTVTEFSQLPVEAQEIIKTLEGTKLTVTGAAIGGQTATVTNKQDGTFTIKLPTSNFVAGELTVKLTLTENEYFTHNATVDATVTVA